MSMLICLGLTLQANRAPMLIGTFRDRHSGEQFTLHESGAVYSPNARFNNLKWAISPSALYLSDWPRRGDRTEIFSYFQGKWVQTRYRPYRENEFTLTGQAKSVYSPVGWFRHGLNQSATYLELKMDGSGVCFRSGRRFPTMWIWDGTFVRVSVTIPQGWAYTLRPRADDLKDHFTQAMFARLAP